MNRLSLVASTLLALLPLWSVAAWGDAVLNEGKPFADTHIILQVSQADPARHGQTLEIANNLGKHYGSSDMVDVEVIAFGGGVPMLFEGSPLRERVNSLMAQGVRFYVCNNTLDSIERREGTRPRVLQGVGTVPSGVAFMVDEIKRGYIPVQP